MAAILSRLQYREISFIQNTQLSDQIVLKNCTEYGSDTACTIQNFKTILQLQVNKLRTNEFREILPEDVFRMDIYPTLQQPPSKSVLHV